MSESGGTRVSAYKRQAQRRKQHSEKGYMDAGVGNSYTHLTGEGTLIPSTKTPSQIRKAQVNTVDLVLANGGGEQDAKEILEILGLLERTGLEAHDVWGRRVGGHAV